MSIWSDIQDRSAGISEREEDKKRYITLDKIEEILKSMKVGTKEGEYPPVLDLNILVEHFEEVHTFNAVIYCFDIIAFVLEVELQHIAYIGVVVDHEKFSI